MDVFSRLFRRHLEDDEPLYLVIHRSWILAIPRFAPPILALIGTWILLGIAPVRPVALAVTLIDVVILLWLLRRYFDYSLDALLITDRAVIDVEWHGWFHRESTRIEYAAIEGVSYEIQGVIGTLLNIGTITIERIGSGDIVAIGDIPRPRDVESAILACQTECLRTKNLKDSSAVKDIIAEIVAERMQLHDLEEDEEIDLDS